MVARNIILDTDIGPDCDDAGALAVLHLLADQGLCRILGIGHCTSNPYGAGTIDVINRYYGRPEIEIGTYYGPPFLEEEICMSYNKYITSHFPNRYKERPAQEVVKMYRRILADQADQSVEYICIGPMNNLSALLNSEADEYSSLDGIELVRQKVLKLTVMGGIFRSSSAEINRRVEKYTGQIIEDTTEWNVGCDIPAARNVAEYWRTPKVYVGLEAGLIVTGGSLKTAVPEDHPVRISYRLHGNEEGRFSWDLLAAEYAVDSSTEHYKESVRGRVRFDERGRTLWTPDETGADCFIELARADEEIEKDMDALLAVSPKGGFPKKIECNTKFH